jgi:hypothetical protein
MTTEDTEAPDTGTEETDPAPTEQPAPAPEADVTDWKTEAEKYKALSRKHEQRAKTNASAAKELEDLKATQLTDQEKAIKDARDEALAEGRAIGDERLIRAEVIAAAAGKVADPSDVHAILTANGALKDLVVDDDGQVDTDAITAAIDALVKAKPHLAAVRSPSFGARAPVDAPSSNADMDAWIRSGGIG